ncbi:IclR family transcriptional regulator [Flavisphingomonas formosensis]|uniref:IclR family transcriptional regulator n=1 Tax=Flavisphingomonas formosensis TaxID=861534 RepID=UPI0012FA6620|nr:helix-turn-helix domain-containing protein [Sphingomonas formosensis]
MLQVAQAYSHILPSEVGEDKWIIKSAHRVLQVFEFFTDARRPASATEIANALDFPQSSTSMLLRSLVSLGYLDYHREGRTFQPTIRLSLLGGWIPERIDVASSLIEMLSRLHEEIGETIILAEQHRNMVRYIYVVQRPLPGLSYYIRPGTLRPALMTAAGRMLLTLNSEREVTAIIQRSNAEESDPANWVKRAEFMQELDTCRREGFSYTHRGVEDDETGVMCAVLAPPEAGARPMSVAVWTAKRRYTPEAALLIRERLMAVGRPADC